MDAFQISRASCARLSLLRVEADSGPKLNAHWLCPQIPFQVQRRAGYGLQLAKTSAVGLKQRDALHCRAQKKHHGVLAVCQVSVTGREAVAGQMFEWLQRKGFPDQVCFSGGAKHYGHVKPNDCLF